jgi:hypothetical protein
MKKLTAKTTLILAIAFATLAALSMTHRVPAAEAAGDRWPGNVVPYYIDDHVNDDHRNAIEQALNIWEERTALHFERLSPADLEKRDRAPYLHYIDRGTKYHSYSYKSIKDDGDLDAFPYLRSGDWVIKLNDCRPSPICSSGDNEPFHTNYHIPLHETGHVLGLPHEASRSDRKDGVRFFPCCVDESTESFEQSLQHVEALKPYDITSIMQYSSKTHCKKHHSDDECVCLPLLDGSDVNYTRDPTVAREEQKRKNDAGECVERTNVKGKFIDENPSISYEDVNTIYQMYPPSLGQNETSDHFGQAMAAGDFDGDSYTDLAVGAPGESPGDDPKSGAVFLFKGTHTGLVPWRVLTQTGLGINQSGDRFGETLAAADFNEDGRAELVVGAPGERVAGATGGAVFVFMGSIAGPTTVNGYLLHQDNIGFSDSGHDLDLFGAALAVGNFNGDSRLDLAIGAPGKNPGGRVYTLTWDKTRPSGDKFVKFDRVGNQRAAGDLFGTALVAADVNSDGFDDLVVGAPGTHGVGAIFVFTGDNAKFRSPTEIKEPEGPPRENGDDFGAALATGHFAGGATPQIVVGTPGKKGTGWIFVLRLKYNGNNFDRIDRWNAYDQHSLTDNGPNDRFGQVFAVADFDRDGKDDLAVGIPDKHLFVFNGGAVALFRGTSVDEFLTGWAYYTQPESYPPNRHSDRFGGALAAANFNRKPSIPDLAIGVPGKGDESTFESGAMFVARGDNEGQPPTLSLTKNPTKAADPPANPSFWTYFDQELAGRR